MKAVSSSSQPHERRFQPVRRRGYDFAQTEVHFVTIVIQRRACLLGNVIAEEMRLNDAGKMVQRMWQGLPDRFPDVGVDEFIVMPNHVHGIISIAQPVGATLGGAQETTPPAWAIQNNAQRATTRVAPMRDGTASAAGTTSGVPDLRLKTPTAPPRVSRPSLEDVVGAFKALTTAGYVQGVQSLGWPQLSDNLWEPDYSEHVVRCETTLTRIRHYVHDNPAWWALDRENPMVAQRPPENS